MEEENLAEYSGEEPRSKCRKYGEGDDRSCLKQVNKEKYSKK